MVQTGGLQKKHLIGEKPTLIHFWSVSCHLCKEAMPQVNELSRQISRSKAERIGSSSYATL